jgi:anti-repressor protein
MSEIVINNNDGLLTVNSYRVAKDFGKNHFHVVRDIKNLTIQNWMVKKWFFESTYITDRNRQYKCYEMTRDGFSLLVMGFTGEKALEFKIKYI